MLRNKYIKYIWIGLRYIFIVVGIVTCLIVAVRLIVPVLLGQKETYDKLKIAKSSKSIEDIVNRLGPPDEVFIEEKKEDNLAGKISKHQLQKKIFIYYEKLDLRIFIHIDQHGRVEEVYLRGT